MGDQLVDELVGYIQGIGFLFLSIIILGILGALYKYKIFKITYIGAIFCTLVFFTQQNFSELYSKYFETEIILYTPKKSEKYINFYNKNSSCDDLIIVFTKYNQWNPSAHIKKCSDQGIVFWTSTNFHFSKSLDEKVWIIKNEK